MPIDDETKTEQGSTPFGFRQDHEAMRAASETPVTGPAATDTLAASGGLDLPGSDASRARPVAPASAIPEPIPGERDASTMTRREPGAMGALFNADVPQPETSMMSDETVRDRELEGGGHDALRRQHDQRSRK